MGTSYHVTVTGAVESVEELQGKVDEVLIAVNKQMSTYDASSELMKLNVWPVGQPFPLSPALSSVLAESQRINVLTQGAFDVTVGPLVNRWGFGPNDTQDVPDALEIETLLARVGSRWLSLSNDGRTAVRLKDIFIDLSAIAKGFGVDQVAKLLDGLGYQNYLVEIGGEIKVSGHNGLNEPWRIAIERPELAQGSIQAAIAISDNAMATSGSYRNYQIVDGKRFSHTIDPTTGSPVTHSMVSVTVIAPACEEADALATGFSVMGPDATLAIAEQHQIPVFLLEQVNGQIRERWSTSFSPYLQSQSTP